MALVYGNCPHPPYQDRLVPSSQTSAYNDLGPRVPIGTCQHSMVGYLWSTDRWFRDDPTTGRRATGLTDYGVGGSKDGADDGLILRWNDPRGRRSGWANGGSDGLEGDGIAFVRALGVNSINRNLVSIERSDGGDYNTNPLSDKQFESLAQLHAYWADQARIPWTSYPTNPHVAAGGLVTYIEHREFATKACPFPPVTAEVTRLHDRIREILRQYQGELTVQPPTDPPIDATPDPDKWPNDWTTSDLTAWFGNIKQVDFRRTTPVITEGQFYNKGLVSNAWVARAVKEGITAVNRIPKPTFDATTAAKDGTISRIITFPRSGYPDWVLFIGDGNSGAIWIQ